MSRSVHSNEQPFCQLDSVTRQAVRSLMAISESLLGNHFHRFVSMASSWQVARTDRSRQNLKTNGPKQFLVIFKFDSPAKFRTAGLTILPAFIARLKIWCAKILRSKRQTKRFSMKSFQSSDEQNAYSCSGSNIEHFVFFPICRIFLPFDRPFFVANTFLFLLFMCLKQRPPIFFDKRTIKTALFLNFF